MVKWFEEKNDRVTFDRLGREKILYQSEDFVDKELFDFSIGRQEP